MIPESVQANFAFENGEDSRKFAATSKKQEQIKKIIICFIVVCLSAYCAVMGIVGYGFIISLEIQKPTPSNKTQKYYYLGKPNKKKTIFKNSKSSQTNKRKYGLERNKLEEPSIVTDWLNQNTLDKDNDKNEYSTRTSREKN